MKRPRDSQRQRLYDWEDRVVRAADPTQPVVKRAMVTSKRPHPTKVLATVDGTVYRSTRANAIFNGWPVQDYFASRIETKVIGGLTQPQAQEFVNRVCRAYGLGRVPVVVFGGTTFARSRYDRRIKLPTWSRSFVVTAHEVAHAIIYVKGYAAQRDSSLRYVIGCAAHGPEFLAVFIDILAKHLFYDRIELRNSARAAGLKIADKAYPLEVAS